MNWLYDQLFDQLSCWIVAERPTAVIGDMNWDYSENTKMKKFMTNLGFSQLIMTPTYDRGTLIDHIYTNNILCTSTSGIIINDVADHFDTFHIANNKPNHTNSNTQRPTRKLTNNNISKFREYLGSTNFDTIMEIDFPNEAYNRFMELYKNIFDKAFPVTITKRNKKYIKREPWVTKGFLTSSRTKAKLLKTKLKSPSDLNIQRYKTFIQVYNKVKKNLKISYYKNVLEKNKSSMKNTWSILKQAIGKQNKKSNIPQTLKVNNKNMSDK